MMEDKGSLLPPCKVCEGKATGVHFGAITCEACKAFYKRSRGRLKPYKCRSKAPGTCKVRFDIVPMCPYCRHLRIIESGMSEEGIHRGRWTVDRKAQLVIEAKDIELENHRREGEQSRSGSKNSLSGSENTTTKTKNFRSFENVGSGSENTDSPQENYQIGVKRSIQTAQPSNFDWNSDDSNYELCAKLLHKPGDSFLDVDSFITCEYNEDDIINMAERTARADADHQLYKTCEFSIAEARNRRYAEEQKVKEALVGPLKPLSHDEYTDVYKATGMDIDDYRAKARVMEYMRGDIDTYIDFIKHLPGYEELNLHDRITIAKGGFAGWLILSSIRLYNKDLNAIGIVYDILWSSSDFVRYIGKDFSEAMKQSLSVLLKNNATPKEIALLKALHVYTVRPEYGIIHNTLAIDKRHQILQKALDHAVRQSRSPDEVTWVLKELKQTLEPLNKVAKSFRQGVSQWPLKFPEYSCPRILQEIVGQKCEEELLVAVSMQLKGTHL